MERTVEDFVDDMLAKGRDWMAIMAVARAIRNGHWYEAAQAILQERKIMPTDEAVIKRMKDEAAKRKIEIPPKYKKTSKKPVDSKG